MDKFYKMYRVATQYYNWVLRKANSLAAKNARDYLAGRDITFNDYREWDLGFASKSNGLSRFLYDSGFSFEDMYKANLVYKNEKTGKYTDRFYNRVMFPIRNKNGLVCGFGGRAVSQDNPAKYLNTAKIPIFDKSKLFYGMDKVGQKDIEDNNNEMYVVEGYTDVIAMHKFGFSSAVGTLGTALTDKHLKHLEEIRPKRVVLMFDGDKAGQKALDRTLTYIKEIVNMNDIDFVGLVLPDNLDPKEYLDKYGSEAMRDELKRSRDIVEIKIDNIFREHDLDVIGEGASAAQRCCALLAKAENILECDKYCKYIAGKLRFSTSRDMVNLVRYELIRQEGILDKQKQLRAQRYIPAKEEVGKGSENAGREDGRNSDVARVGVAGREDGRNALASEIESDERDDGESVNLGERD